MGRAWVGMEGGRDGGRERGREGEREGGRVFLFPRVLFKVLSLRARQNDVLYFSATGASD